MQHELDTAGRLTRHGYDVEFRPTRDMKNADILLNGEIWEMKSPIGTGKQTMGNQLGRGVTQAFRIVIDLARTPIDEERALAELAQRWEESYPEIRRVLVLRRDGSLQEVRRGR